MKPLPKRATLFLWVLAAFCCFAAINLLVRRVSFRLDLTRDRLYTLTSGSKAIVSRIDFPVTLRFYRNRAGNLMPVAWRTFANRVEDLLREYVRVGDGKIVLEIYDPAPDTPVEDAAIMDGVVKPKTFYLGLVVNCLDRDETLSFLQPSRENALEYEISRAIQEVSRPRKKAIGIISDLPMLGESQVLAAAGHKQRPWICVQELRTLCDVRRVSPDADAIPAGLDALLIVHPKYLSLKTKYAIDQYLLGGGKLLVAVDPYCVSDMLASEVRFFKEPPPPGASTLKEFFAAWGVGSPPPASVVVSPDNALRDETQPSQTEYPVILSLLKPNLTMDDPVLSGLSKVDMVFAGAFTLSPVPGLMAKTLAATSPGAGPLAGFDLKTQVPKILSDYKPGDKPLPLIVRLRGTFPTAFPGGPPPGSKAQRNAFLKRSAIPGEVLLLGDADMLFDPFCVDSREKASTYGKKINNNLDFIVNAVDGLIGDRDLIAARDRDVKSRPFTRLDAALAEDRRRYQLETAALEEKRSAAEARINALQKGKDEDQRYVWSPEQLAELKTLRAETERAWRDLREIRRAFRAKKEAIETRIKLCDIVLVPALVILAGLLAAGWARRERRTNP